MKGCIQPGLERELWALGGHVLWLETPCPVGRVGAEEDRRGPLEQEPQSPGLREVLLLPDKEEIPLGKFEMRTTSGHRIHSYLSKVLHPDLCTSGEPLVGDLVYSGLGLPFTRVDTPLPHFLNPHLAPPLLPPESVTLQLPVQLLERAPGSGFNWSDILLNKQIKTQTKQRVLMGLIGQGLCLGPITGDFTERRGAWEMQ